ncbi:MAG: hypothetical protein ABI234_07835, partial [Ktedonobacteraceae bacterium]
MKFASRILTSSIGVIALLLMVLTTLFASLPTVNAAGLPIKKAPSSTHILQQGPVTLALTHSSPLHQPVNSPKAVTFIKRGATKTARSSALLAPQAGSNQISLLGCLLPTIDLKVLVISADGNEADLPAIKQTLDYLGTPYSVYVATQTPNGLTPDKLGNGCHGYYQGIILTTGALSYFNGSAFVSALSQQEWVNMWSYESQMSVRELSWYTLPTADYGYQAFSSAIDTTATPLGVTLTANGRTTFPYVTSGATITIQNAFTYLTNALADGTTTPLLTDSNGHDLGHVRNYSDGRQILSLTFDSNPFLAHTIVLSYGLVNWLTKGIFLGERHVYMSPQVDDMFIDDSDWTTSTPCGTPVDSTGTTYRINSNDVQSVLAWQNSQHANPVTQNVTLTLAFNGAGTVPGTFTPDTLTPSLSSNQAQFNWVSHTYDHTNLDNVDYPTATSEITLNNQVATSMNFTHFSSSAMVTPDISGLHNPNFLQAAVDNGIRYLVTDTSLPGYNNPTPNTGIYNPLQPQILMIPRHPNNLFFNVSTPSGWVAEYNCIYHNFWGRDLSYNEILNIESQTLLGYMLKGELDPWMFHQPNMRAYDGVHTLLSDLLGLTLQKYQQYYNLPIV